MSHLHFMGIGGVSMQGLARWWHADGHVVSGCDLSDGPAQQALRALGMHVWQGHDPDHLDGVDTLVTTMAVPSDHPEVQRAHEVGIRVVPRIGLLAELFERRVAIGITGTHGKSTTTGLTATLALAADVDPSIQIGASLAGLEHNVRYGNGRHLVAEVDESDPGFALLRPSIAVITNLEDDHVAGEFDERRNYHASMRDLEHATAQFAHSAEHVLYCLDWPGLEALLGDHPGAARYGVHPDADYRIVDMDLTSEGSRFALRLPSGRVASATLTIPGHHNVLNAAAALAAIDLAGLDAVAVAPALATFRGVGRRWQRWGDVNGALVIDDYAHHPTEVRATLTAARSSGRRVRAVLQPHRWVRTARLWPALADAASLADEVLVLDVYASGESAIDGVGASLIVARLREAGVSASHHDMISAVAHLRATMHRDDLVLTLGAGDVWRVAEALVDGGPLAGGNA
ncbi:MAG: UDP-N-acetylmuramate--L-alanine ligase [Trueperaceae bacterium]|nr:MAG: UDP-N-acetylmuramate--L-alanine ligase [Trueperaceae bacterium]